MFVTIKNTRKSNEFRSFFFGLNANFEFKNVFEKNRSVRLFSAFSLAAIFPFLFSVFFFSWGTFVAAQESAADWDALFERRDGWLAADGVYSLDLTCDVATTSENTSSENGALVKSTSDAKTLFWFSDTFGGSTRLDGREFDAFQMTNHSFAILDGREPASKNVRFFWRRDDRNETSKRAVSNAVANVESLDNRVETPENLLGVERWLQDGIVFRGRIWLSAILVGDAWKPARIDAVSLGRRPDGTPDFDDVQIDETAPLSFKTKEMQIVFGAAITDDSNDEFLYIFGYLDRFDAGSRKDLVVARAPRERFDDFSAWRFFDGKIWSPNVADACSPNAVLVENVATEFSVSKIPFGKNAGKFLFVYTPGAISNKIAFRVAETPFGPFGKEIVFYRSTVPNEFAPGVRCYNAKAHPIFGNENRVLVSYNVNRLGSLPRRPAEYRPRFVWLDYRTVDEATSDAFSDKTFEPTDFTDSK